MPYVKNWLHCVWGTKKRIHYFNDSNKNQIIEHILENAKSKRIYIDSINLFKDHIHCIISLSADQPLSKTIQLIKGEASHWINKISLTNEKFEWADEYFAVSISESYLDKVREYIENQELHHRIKTWDEECNEFFQKYSFQLHG